MSKRIGFVGLGTMSLPMTINLKKPVLRTSVSAANMLYVLTYKQVIWI